MSEQSGYLSQLGQQISQQIGDDNPLLDSFTTHFWHAVTAEDIARRSLADDAAITIEAWRLFEQRQSDQIEIRVSNPELARDGWYTPYTVVAIAAPNMPFAVDTVLMALSNDGIVTHFLNNVVFAVERDDGRICALTNNNKGKDRELMIYAEVDRLPDEQRKALQERLALATRDLSAAVSDFAAMKAKLAAVAAEIQPSNWITAEEASEADAFLKWLLSENFTFLGYREFAYSDDTISQVGDPLGVLRVRKPASNRTISRQPETTQRFLLEPSILAFSKGGSKSLVHRPAYPDYVGIRRFDDDGNVIGEHGFLGLYTSRVYMDSPTGIPVLRRKLSHAIEHSGFDPDGFDGRVLRQVLATYPRDELFQISQDELREHAVAVTNFHERRRIKLFVREDRYGLFVSCLVYLPRDLFDTKTRLQIEKRLIAAFSAEDTQYDIHLSESILVRLQFILRISPDATRDVDIAALEQDIAHIAYDWRAELSAGLSEQFGETQGRELLLNYGDAFSAGYREYYSAEIAVADIGCIEAMGHKRTLNTRLYHLIQDDPETLRLKVFHKGNPLPLSDQVPKLENLGFRISEEKTYRVERTHGERITIHDFKLYYQAQLDLSAIAPLFNASFSAIWLAQAEDDSFNRLILASGLGWQQVNVLRVYAQYMQQIRFGFSREFISNTLHRHQHIGRLLVEYFEARMAPDGSSQQAVTLQERIVAALDEVSLLNEDRVLRRILELMNASLRTNYFQRDTDGEAKSYLAIKFDPFAVQDMPLPRPRFEIYVAAPTFEGVHLRAGDIARGGLRWSDRLEDYRTEVLGLMKAQVVKNGVIVPSGAKGGFVLKSDKGNDDVVTAYKRFISGLLDVTDNLDGGKVVPPPRVRRHDKDDPYLVVAADKGTATFSDHANAVAQDYGFWLDDAFASGGSNGYDHKKMGITARGAWVSVQRHFRERGTDVQKDPVTVIGIGDMGGDVFGNGMLRSESLCLVGAFNHLHIFVDPAPDAAASFAERQRLFALPRSSWEDYDRSLISSGGGIFSRQAKSITITPEMQAVFAITATALSPDDLIHQMLKAPVDLLWNGGIGTYVRSSTESHEAVGDRANDHIRIEARELRAVAVGEGGNLGLTQQARIEYAQNGGMINTDSIDNSAGVNCSDREVNIKVLLNRMVSDGDLTRKQRNQMLESLEEEVAEIVLEDSRNQTRSISLAAIPLPGRESEFTRFMARMEAEAGLDRKLEHLPTDETLLSRNAAAGLLTRPELSVLLAYAKIHIKNHLVSSDIASEPVAAREALSAFPPTLAAAHEPLVLSHQLLPEIVSSQLANTIVDSMGITFVAHHMDFVGGSVDEVARAFLMFAGTFGIREWIDDVDMLDAVTESIKQEMLLELMRLGRHCTRWLLRHHRESNDPQGYIDHCQPIAAELVAQRESAMSPEQADAWQQQVTSLTAAGVPDALAQRTAAAARLADILPIIEIANQTGAAPVDIAQDYVELSQALGIDVMTETIANLTISSYWQQMERNALVDTIKTLQATLAVHAIKTEQGNVGVWLEHHPALTTQWQAVVNQASASPDKDLSLYSITTRKLQELCAKLGSDDAVTSGQAPA